MSESTDGVITLKNVRLAFPDLWVPTAFQEGQQKKYGATFLIKKDDPQIKVINHTIRQIAKEKWKAKAENVLNSIKGSNQTFCFHDGDNKADLDGYAGHYYLTAKNASRPKVADVDGTPLQQGDGKPYAGCFVYAKVQLWAQDNNWGKAMRASLLGVQFLRDGDSFGAGKTMSYDEFEDLSAEFADSDDFGDIDDLV